ncbi:GNAT family N-acetyltransferase [Phenylobacterium sp.]|jgi:ribosomal protein S18 acetylase RimI-like enzyme|uniref:GNAT family N-acetyltransferase n=1 Tax=Phenylobacterium sp. TaxID=1871053 RepID=UPI002E307E42|nr:GNAT family N-acetyltransferase [Phenylobacterium sp.]HEX2559676.1 GNAT family N-acetyltransferase [Phenylobacterium sp.]
MPQHPNAAPVLVRNAVAADVPALGRLGALLVASHHEFDAMRFFPAEAGTERGYGRFLAGQIGQEDAVLLVADDAGQVVGYAYGRLEGTDFMALRGPAGMLHDLIVDPAVRRRRVGQTLLEAALAALADLGAPRVVLSTAAKNAAAQAMFARAGFRPTMIEMTREVP